MVEIFIHFYITLLLLSSFSYQSRLISERKSLQQYRAIRTNHQLNMWGEFSNDESKEFFGLLNKSKIIIDNTSFWLHRTATVSILVLSTVVLTTNTYLDKPMHCVGNSNIPKYSAKYCWMYGTRTYSGKEYIKGYSALYAL